MYSYTACSNLTTFVFLNLGVWSPIVNCQPLSFVQEREAVAEQLEREWACSKAIGRAHIALQQHQVLARWRLIGW